jgi:hypothetical protein
MIIVDYQALIFKMEVEIDRMNVIIFLLLLLFASEFSL